MARAHQCVLQVIMVFKPELPSPDLRGTARLDVPGMDPIEWQLQVIEAETVPVVFHRAAWLQCNSSPQQLAGPGGWAAPMPQAGQQDHCPASLQGATAQCGAADATCRAAAGQRVRTWWERSIRPPCRLCSGCLVQPRRHQLAARQRS